MPQLSLPAFLMRRGTAAALGVTLAAAGAAALPSAAMASHSQISMIEDFTDAYVPSQTLQQFRELGANTVRVILPWDLVAPSPNATHKPNFNATDPGAYSQSAWQPYDNIIRTAAADGLNVDLTVQGGAPRWAEASAAPRANGVNPQYVAWRPNAAAYGQFMRAVGTRYSGSFTPAGQSTLPRVHFWAIFNEPNFGQDLGPQAINDSSVATAPMMYRGLANQGYDALRATGHGRDTILIGELAAEGFEPGPYPKRSGGLPGNYGQTRPLLFIRDLYCVNSSYQPLRGYAARSTGCPTNTAGTRRFRGQNPGLFNASGFADHPYDSAGSPADRSRAKVDYATFPVIGNLEGTLDRVNRVYGSGKHFPIYNTEYGYITNPPSRGRGYPSPNTAAYYINWAEYLSWKNGRMASYMQYLLQDPPPNTGVYNGFASGLRYNNGKEKPSYNAYRLAVYMPQTNLRRSTNAEVWGNARTAPFMVKDGNGNQFVSIQLNGKTIKTNRVNGGFFDLHMKFPKSGTVRLAYTYPQNDSFLPLNDLGRTVYSRSFRVNVR